MVRNPNHTWNILKPIEADATRGAVDGLTETIANAQLTRTIEDKPDSLRPFGLDKPAVTLTVTSDNKGVLPALLVGRVSPVSNGCLREARQSAGGADTTGDFSTRSARRSTTCARTS